MDPTAPKKINKYEVVDVIGRGGMGVVYKAIDRSLNRLVAIKMVTNAEQEQGKLLSRFYREAQFTANLRHPNIVTVYDLGEFEGSPYLVMEYLAGQSLECMLASEPITLLRKINYMRQVCNGLQYAHTRQPSIVHRDIKPANIVVVEDGTVKIVDFGIARLEASRNTRPGQLMGSYHYISPEQIKDAEVDGRADIFSAGVVLYQLLTLNRPFEGGGVAQTLRLILHDSPPPLDRFIKAYPPALDGIVARALAKDRSERYQTAAELGFDLLGVEETLKREMFSGNLERAEEFLRQGDCERARRELTSVLNVDHQHARANQLMRDLQQTLARQQRKRRAHDLHLHAQEMLQQNRLADALSSLNEAIQLDNSDAELQAFREHVVELKARAEKFNEILVRVERACASRDLDTAARDINEALQLDPSSTRAKSLKAIIDAKIEEREKERQAQELLASARQSIASRQFSDALRMLGNVEVLNPTVSGLRDLIALAEAGREQELRQKALAKATGEIKDALQRTQLSLARNLAVAALERFPDHPELVNLKALTEQQIAVAKRDKTIASIRALLASGEVDAAQQKLNAARIDLGDAADVRELEGQIRAERERIALEEVNTALGEAEQLLEFGATTQALAKLESVAALLDSVTPEIRSRCEQLKAAIHQRLYTAQQQADQEKLSREASPTPMPPLEHTVPPMSRPTPAETVVLPRGIASRSPLSSSTASQKQQKPEHTIAELTPIEGIALPNLSAADQPTADLNTNAPNAGAPPEPPPARTVTLFGSYVPPVAPDATLPLTPTSSTKAGPETMRVREAWPDETLRAVERHLATFIGPLARVMVKKAAAQTTDADELYKLLAASIERPNDRQAFLATKTRISPGQSLTSPGARGFTHTMDQSAVSAPREEVPPAVVERAARLLAPYAGPISFVLARRAAQRADSVRALYRLLAEHLENEAERNRFLSDAGFPDAA